MMRDLFFEAILALYIGSMLFGLLALQRCEPDPLPMTVYVTDEELDELEAKLILAHSTVRRWEELAERRQHAEAVVCEQVAFHVSPLPQEVR